MSEGGFYSLFPHAFSGSHSQAHAFGLAQWSLLPYPRDYSGLQTLFLLPSGCQLAPQAAAKDRTSVAQLRPQGRGTKGHTSTPVSPPVTGSQCPLASAGLPDPQARPLGPPARWKLAEADPAGAAARLTRPLASLRSCPAAERRSGHRCSRSPPGERPGRALARCARAGTGSAGAERAPRLARTCPGEGRAVPGPGGGIPAARASRAGQFYPGGTGRAARVQLNGIDPSQAQLG